MTDKTVRLKKDGTPWKVRADAAKRIPPLTPEEREQYYREHWHPSLALSTFARAVPMHLKRQAALKAERDAEAPLTPPDEQQP